MKIKILQNIPGFSKEAVAEVIDGKIKIYGHSYNAKKLVDRGWAEEIDNEIDIDQIRYESRTCNCSLIGGYHKPQVSEEEYVFLKSYRVVKEVIDQLNGDWKPDEIDRKYYFNNSGSYQIYIDWLKGEYVNMTTFPFMRSREIGEKVIELCEPELKVLFRVK